MADNPNIPAEQRNDLPFLRTLAANRRTGGIVFLILAAGLAALPGAFIYSYGTSGLETIVWGSILSLALLGAGVYCLVSASRPGLSEVDEIRLLLLVLGGVVGFATALYGMILPFTQYRAVFSGGLTEWSKNPLPVWGCTAAVFGGFAVMFVSLLLARGVERTSLTMRRLLYGYNAFFSSFLLLAVLLLVNVLCYSPLPVFGSLKRSYDWTASGVYTLSPATQSQLAALKQPVKIVVMMPGRSRALPALETMLTNCQAVSPMVTWQTRSPELMDPDEREALRAKYEIPPDMDGMLVIYGTEPKTYFTFIKEADLYEDRSQMNPLEDDPSGGKKKFTFKGEAALGTALDYLAEGKSKPVVYFTQGNGELAFAEGGQATDSMSILIENLSRGNFDLRPLKLGPDVKEIPSDATVVVLARPKNALPEAAVNALRAYLKGADGKHGNLIALLSPIAGVGATQGDARLEGLLAEYDVHLGHDRVLTIDLEEDSPPTRLIASPNEGGNRLAQAFAARGYNFLFESAQTVEPLTTNPEFRAEVLVETLPQLRVWTVTDPRVDVTDLVKDVRKKGDKFTQFSPKPVPLAVTVSEARGAPPVPGHEFLPPGGRPVLAVFGGADWVSNDTLQGAAAQVDYSLFASTLNWMRDKPNLGPQIKTKSGAERDEFSMDKITLEGARRIVWTPGFVMLIGIVALGLGVALVRRR